jgi:branched-chain amino acid transport system ATP-binding protein
MTATLSCAGLDAGYHHQPVVRDLTLAVQAGEILTMLGVNGAGKTTSLLTLAGLLPPIRGEVRLDGKLLNFSRPHLAARAGVALVPDDKCLFTTLSVIDNLSFGRRGKGALDEALSYFPALESRMKMKAGVLSGGEQQMLALARALVSEPRVMLIDELSMGLAPLVVQDMLAVVKRIAREKATAVILVEQHVQMALGIADRALVLAHGEVVLESPADVLAADPGRLRDAYLSAGTTQRAG